MIAILIAKVRVNYVLTREGRGKPSSLPPSRNARFEGRFFSQIELRFPNMEVI